jgi:hypothetical protein
MYVFYPSYCHTLRRIHNVLPTSQCVRICIVQIKSKTVVVDDYISEPDVFLSILTRSSCRLDKYIQTKHF